MIDLHLINVALAGLGAGVAAVLLIAAGIYTVAVLGRRGRDSGQLTHTTPAAPASLSTTEIREPVLR